MPLRRLLFVLSSLAIAANAARAQSCLGVSTTHAYRSSIGFGAAFATPANGYSARLGVDRGRIFGAIIGGVVDGGFATHKAKVIGIDLGTTIPISSSRRVQLCPFLQGRYQRSAYRTPSVALQRSAPDVLIETASLSTMDVTGGAMIRQSVLGGLSLSGTFVPSSGIALVPFAGVGMEYVSLLRSSSHKNGVVHAGLGVGFGRGVTITPSLRTSAIGRNGEMGTSYSFRVTFGSTDR